MSKKAVKPLRRSNPPLQHHASFPHSPQVKKAYCHLKLRLRKILNVNVTWGDPPPQQNTALLLINHKDGFYE